MGTIHVHDGTQGRRAERRGFSLFDKKMGRGDGLVINGVNLEVGAMPGARKDFWRGKWKRNGREGGFHYLTRKWTTKADQLIGPLGTTKADQLIGPLGTKAGTMKADQLIGPLHYEGTTKADSGERSRTRGEHVVDQKTRVVDGIGGEKEGTRGERSTTRAGNIEGAGLGRKRAQRGNGGDTVKGL